MEDKIGVNDAGELIVGACSMREDSDSDMDRGSTLDEFYGGALDVDMDEDLVLSGLHSQESDTDEDMTAELEFAAGDVDEMESNGSEHYRDLISQSKTGTENRGRPVGKFDQERTNKRKRKSLVPMNTLMAYLCCASLCLSIIPAEVMKKARDAFQSLSVSQKTQWVFDWISTHTRRPDNKTVFLIGGHQVCRKAWLVCLGIPASTFYSTLAKFRSRFSTCDVCNKLKNEIEKTTNRDTKNKLFRLREIHLEQQNLERRKYYKHAQNLRSATNRYLSIILDGMDQDKTSLPHTRSTPKGLSSLWKVKVNLMGAIVHGYGVYGFFDTFQWAHGSSFTISVLVHTLLMMTSLPPVVYLQLDNCQCQNKNRYMLGFLALLVEVGVFEKIKLSFLMVGHTHEDIDQLFSRFSIWLGTRDINTLDGLVRGFEECYTPKPTGLKLHEVYNFGEFLPLNDISNHSRPHVFKIIKEYGKAVIYTKKWSTDKKWQNCEGDYLLKECPSGPVKKLCPSLSRIDEKIINDMQTFATFYKDEVMARYWDEYFTDLKEEEDNWHEEHEDVIEQLLAKRKEPEDETELDEIITGLEIPSVEEPIPAVLIGGKKKLPSFNNIMEPGKFILLDMAKYADEWPQVAKIISIVSANEVEIQWYRGAKTTPWYPATRRISGTRGGKNEPITETVSTKVIWLSGFSLTPAGLLPKNVRQEIEVYFD